MVASALAVGGCDEPLVDGHFTEAEWAYLQTFRLDATPTCPDEFELPLGCERVAELGQIIFFERGFSGPLTVLASSFALKTLQ